MKKIFCLLIILSSPFSFSSDLITVAEKSGWKKTGSAEETAALCKTFERRFKSVNCSIYGKTPEGRSQFYLTVGDIKKPVVWVQAGIHAGEIDGKDAVFWLLRNLLTDKKSDIFKNICLVFVPIVNLDGHERFGKWNRPNQIGPEEMGWRTTSQNINMNRDFMKADAQETQALLKLWHKFDPVLSLDLHVTDGAQFQPEVGLIINPNKSHGNGALNELGQKFENELLTLVKSAGHLALPFYPSFETEDDPQSGFARYVSTARFANGYWFNNNRLGMLVETHSWKDYATRVKTHYDTVLASLKLANQNARIWQQAEQELDNKKLAGQKVDIDFKHTEKHSIIDFPGYKYEIKKSEISGGNVIKYYPSKPEIWKIPLYEELIPALSVVAPNEGYFISSVDRDWIIPKLNVHGIKFQEMKSLESRELEVFRAIKADFSPASYEGHQTLTVAGEWKKEKVKVLKNSLFVPINQPRSRLIIQLFEPVAKDSFLSWGFFNRFFERKEYMENYVTEEVAIEMIKNQEIQKEFEAKLKSDSEFAKDPDKRFLFFYKKHPSWDEKFYKYPVYKL